MLKNGVLEKCWYPSECQGRPVAPGDLDVWKNFWKLLKSPKLKWKHLKEPKMDTDVYIFYDDDTMTIVWIGCFISFNLQILDNFSGFFCTVTIYTSRLYEFMR